MVSLLSARSGVLTKATRHRRRSASDRRKRAGGTASLPGDPVQPGHIDVPVAAAPAAARCHPCRATQRECGPVPKGCGLQRVAGTWSEAEAEPVPVRPWDCRGQAGECLVRRDFLESNASGGSSLRLGPSAASARIGRPERISTRSSPGPASTQTLLSTVGPTTTWSLPPTCPR